MNRRLMPINVEGQSFLQKFRNGFITIQSEVNKLEQITEDLKNLPKCYFAEQTLFLDNLNPIHEEVLKLHDEINDTPINLDPIEQRLLALREKLTKFEEDPNLLAQGYKPYIPDDSLLVVEPELPYNEVVQELSFSSPIAEQSKQTSADVVNNDQATSTLSFEPVSEKVNHTNDCTPTINVLDSISKPLVTLTPKQPQPQVEMAPNIAHCLSILQKWSKNNNDTSAGSQSTTINSNQNEFIKPSLPLPHFKPIVGTPLSSKTNNANGTNLTDKSKCVGSINRSKTFTMEQRPKSFQSSTSTTEDTTGRYETVEFTPGMTSKVIRK